MNETTFKIDAATKEKIHSILQAEAISKFVTSVKEAGDTGTFEVMISTEDIDRAGEVIKLDAWDFSHYLKSPVVLWGHNYQEPPIGICLSLEKVNNGIKATGKFAPTPFAQQIRTLYDAGMCRATSVGFIVTEQEGNVITKAELLEFSFVSVPANPYALSLRRSYTLEQDVASLVVKGVQSFLTEKKDAEVTPPADAPAPAPAVDPVPPVEEKPKEEEVTPPAEAPAPEQKGAVAAELSAEEAMEKKYENLDPVWDVISALCHVYFDEKTPVEDFSKLLTETIAILGKIADGTYEAAPEEKSAIISMLKSFSKEKKEAYRVGLQSIFVKENGSKDNGEAPTTEATPAPAPDEKKGVLEARAVLQDVYTILGESLGTFKKIAKENKLF